MKKLTVLGIFFLISFFLASQSTFAAATLRSFGGKVISTTMPGVTCAAQYGIITITPIGGIFPATPYIITATKKTVSAGSWILGLYNTVIHPGSCYTDSAPPAPYPTFDIIKFGTSSIKK